MHYKYRYKHDINYLLATGGIYDVMFPKVTKIFFFLQKTAIHSLLLPFINSFSITPIQTAFPSMHRAKVVYQSTVYFGRKFRNVQTMSYIKL